MEDRARAWRRAAETAVCDVIEPWEHGTVVRATHLPDYWDFNLVRVERDPEMSVAALEDFAQRALAGLGHRRIDVEVVGVADSLRAGFEARGWDAMRLVWMWHAVALPPGPEVPVELVPYDAVDDLRAAWHSEDFPDQDFPGYAAQAREVAESRDVQVFAMRRGDAFAGLAQLERADGGAEITQVYVAPEHRGDGRGTALTRAAIEAAAGTPELWIVADDEDRPKQLYHRLGFRPVWTAMEFQRSVG